VIGQVVRSLQACPIDAVLVVVGHRGAEIAEHLRDFGLPTKLDASDRETALSGSNPKSKIQNPKSALPPVRIIENPNFLQGMLTSVQAGVGAADPATRLFLIALADQPSIPPELIRQLIELFDEQRPGMLVPTFEGRRGHPLLIDARYRAEISALDPEVGLRELLQRHADDLLLSPVSIEAVIRDLDTSEEYEAELARWREWSER
jgi:CTP:molybdopterin cytidylyltransferase MocA